MTKTKEPTLAARSRREPSMDLSSASNLSRRNGGRKGDDYNPTISPQIYSEKYSENDKASLDMIIDWINDHKKNHAWMAKAADINRSMFTQLIGGYYHGRVSQKLQQILDTIEQINARSSLKQTPFISTSVSKILIAGCMQARKNQMFAVLAASVGTGKTRTLREFSQNNAHTYLIEADPQMSPISLMEDLARELDLRTVGRQTMQARFRMIIDAIKTIASPLIILDEAELVNSRTLEYLRRLRDKAGCGVVLAGTTRLYTLISPHGGQFDQIRSRTIFFPKPITHITKQDTARIFAVAFEDRPEVLDAEGIADKQLINAVYGYTNGSMRMLVENIIPAIREYGIPQHNEVSVPVVHAIAKDILSLV